MGPESARWLLDAHRTLLRAVSPAVTVGVAFAIDAGASYPVSTSYVTM